MKTPNPFRVLLVVLLGFFAFVPLPAPAANENEGDDNDANAMFARAHKPYLVRIAVTWDSHPVPPVSVELSITSYLAKEISPGKLEFTPLTIVEPEAGAEPPVPDGQIKHVKKRRIDSDHRHLTIKVTPGAGLEGTVMIRVENPLNAAAIGYAFIAIEKTRVEGEAAKPAKVPDDANAERAGVKSTIGVGRH